MLFLLFSILILCVVIVSIAIYFRFIRTVEPIIDETENAGGGGGGGGSGDAETILKNLFIYRRSGPTVPYTTIGPDIFITTDNTDWDRVSTLVLNNAWFTTTKPLLLDEPGFAAMDVPAGTWYVYNPADQANLDIERGYAVNPSGYLYTFRRLSPPLTPLPNDGNNYTIGIFDSDALNLKVIISPPQPSPVNRNVPVLIDPGSTPAPYSTLDIRDFYTDNYVRSTIPLNTATDNYFYGI